MIAHAGLDRPAFLACAWEGAAPLIRVLFFSSESRLTSRRAGGKLPLETATPRPMASGPLRQKVRT